MRPLLVLLLLILAGLFAYRHFRERPAAPEEARYAPALGRLADEVFGPLDARGADPEAAIRRVMQRARQEVEASQGERKAAQGSLAFCRGLLEANAERRNYLAQWEELRNREFKTLSRTPGLPKMHLGSPAGDPARVHVQDPKQFQLDAHRARWEDYVRKTQPAAQRLLETIRDAERGAAP